MKLRVVFGSKRITSDPDCAQQLPLREVASMEDSRVSAAGDKAKKRGPQGVLENHKDKRLKMDNNNASTSTGTAVKLHKNCTQKFVAKSSNRVSDCGSSGSVNAKQPLNRAWKKCASCGSMVCQCRLPSELSTCPSLSRISSQRSIGRDHIKPNANASSRDCRAKSLTPSLLRKSDVQSHGATSDLDAATICSSTPLTTTPVRDAVSGDGLTASTSDVQVSPHRTLRNAELRVRYADLICKAENIKLLEHCDKKDAEKMQLEKARLEQRLREEKARAESEIRAAEAAKQKEAELETKQQRERLRAEAQIAVEKMAKTVEIYAEPELVREIDRLAWLSQVRSPLEQLGLTLKVKYADNDDDSVLYEEEREEGEIYDDSILYDEEREEGEIY